MALIVRSKPIILCVYSPARVTLPFRFASSGWICENRRGRCRLVSASSTLDRSVPFIVGSSKRIVVSDEHSNSDRTNVGHRVTSGAWLTLPFFSVISRSRSNSCSRRKREQIFNKDLWRDVVRQVGVPKEIIRSMNIVKHSR